MLFRHCAGGVVFWGDSVLLLENDKNEWVLPKGIIRGETSASDTAIERVRIEAGVEAQIVSTAGGTSYEYFSLTRKQPVANEVDWYIMRANSNKYRVNEEQGFQAGGFFPIEKAIRMTTYSQDKSLIRLAYDKFKKLKI